jgi:hypothetical protein
MAHQFVALLHNYQDGHDKIWGAIEGNQCVLSFWGKRGSRLAFKEYAYTWQAEEQAHKKLRKGYERARQDILPADFDAQLMMATLGMVKFRLETV